ncbi:MAG: BLUF domain-containing protein [Planctomycetota bacterium]
MIRYFYISKAAKGLGKEDYQAILNTARKNNLYLGITGLLVVKGNYFAQVLEGDREPVETLYEKIKRDNRHTGVIKVREDETDQRLFPQWQMGFRHLDDSGLSLSKVDLSDPRFVLDPDELSIIFRSFIEN